MTTRFGVFVPQGWRMDLAEIEDPIEQFETMTSGRPRGGRGRLGLDLGLRPLPYGAHAGAGDRFEAWTISATLARDTQNVKIGQMVGCNGYRNPALYAKMASTVDVASHGRLYAGIGAGWYEHEWRAYGFGFPELRDRMGMFREAVRDHPPYVDRGLPAFRGQVLRDRRAHQRAEGRPEASPLVLDRGRRREGYAEAGRPVGRRLQRRQVPSLATSTPSDTSSTY